LVKYARRRAREAWRGGRGPIQAVVHSQGRKRKNEKDWGERGEGKGDEREVGERGRVEEEVQDTSRGEAGGRRVYIAGRAADGRRGGGTSSGEGRLPPLHITGKK
jgi:hypothetical protein